MTSFPHILGNIIHFLQYYLATPTLSVITGSENNTILGYYFESQLKSYGIQNTSVQYHIVNVSRYNNAEAYMFAPNEQIALNLSEEVITEDPTSSTSLRNQAFLI